MRRLHSLATAIGLAVAAIPAAAQSSGWVIGVSAERYDQADALASPLRYGGVGPALVLGWRHAGRTLSGVVLEATPNRLTSRVSVGDAHYLEAWTVGLALPWLRRVRAGGRSTAHLGAQLDVFGAFRRQHFLPGAGTEIYADVIAGLEAAGAWTWRPAAGHTVRQTLSTPVLSAALRTPYTGAKFMPPLMLGAPGRLVGVRYEAEYTRAVSGGVAVGTRYVFRAFRYPDPRSFSVVRHQLGAVVRFGGGGP